MERGGEGSESLEEKWRGEKGSTARKMGDERRDIRTADEKIRGAAGEHADKALVWAEVSAYYSHWYRAFIKS